jgi:Undecaprenyl-phosphate glucose phosphotransferase
MAANGEVIGSAKADKRELSVRGLALSGPIVSGLLGIYDALAILVSGVLIYALYVGWGAAHHDSYLIAITMYAGLVVLSCKLMDLYELEKLVNPYKEVRKILTVSGLIIVTFVSIAFALKISDDFSRVWLFSWWLVSSTLIVIGRVGTYYICRNWARSGRLTRNIAVIGASEQGMRIVDSIDEMGEPWNRVIGFFDDRVSPRTPISDKYSIVGSVNKLRRYSRENRIDDVIVALPWNAEDRLLKIFDSIRELPAHVRLGSDLIGLRLPDRAYSTLCGVVMFDVAPRPIAGWQYVFKIFEDRIIGTLITLLLAPLMLVIAALIKLDSPGPVFFRQTRHGFNKELIKIYKFRSMYHDQRDDDAETLTSQGDPRVTRVGAFLRRTSLDELPQLLNVLNGDLSLIGPRPHALKAKAAGALYEDAVDEYAVRHKVKPGITGWAQVNGWRGDTDSIEKLEGRVRHDLYYIENWSIRLEIKIAIKTVLVVLKGTNAY